MGGQDGPGQSLAAAEYKLKAAVLLNLVKFVECAHERFCQCQRAAGHRHRRQRPFRAAAR